MSSADGAGAGDVRGAKHALQHHDDTRAVHLRHVGRFYRIEVDDEGLIQIVAGSYGDQPGWNLWREKDGQRSGAGSGLGLSGWSQGWPSILDDDGSTGASITPQFLLPTGSGYVPDARFQTKVVPGSVPSWAGRIPSGWSGQVGSTTHEDAQEDTWHPDWLNVLVSANRGAPSYSTLVSDLSARRVDEAWQAPLHSLVEVEEVLPGGLLPEGEALAVHLGPDPEKAPGYGLHVHRGRDVLSSLSSDMGGPIDPGAAGCPHVIGATKDGMTAYAAHATTNLLFRTPGGEFDAPALFELTPYPEPPKAPRTVRAHLGPDPALAHSWAGGVAPGHWRWWAETMVYPIPLEDPEPPPFPPEGEETGDPWQEDPPWVDPESEEGAGLVGSDGRPVTGTHRPRTGDDSTTRPQTTGGSILDEIISDDLDPLTPLVGDPPDRGTYAGVDNCLLFGGGIAFRASAWLEDQVDVSRATTTEGGVAEAVSAAPLGVKLIALASGDGSTDGWDYSLTPEESTTGIGTAAGDLVISAADFDTRAWRRENERAFNYGDDTVQLVFPAPRARLVFANDQCTTAGSTRYRGWQMEAAGFVPPNTFRLLYMDESEQTLASLTCGSFLGGQAIWTINAPNSGSTGTTNALKLTSIHNTGTHYADLLLGSDSGGEVGVQFGDTSHELLWDGATNNRFELTHALYVDGNLETTGTLTTTDITAGDITATEVSCDKLTCDEIDPYALMWTQSPTGGGATRPTILNTFGNGDWLRNDGRRVWYTTADSDRVYLFDADIGTTVQAYDAQLASLAALSYGSNAGKVVAVNSGETGFELIDAGGDHVVSDSGTTNKPTAVTLGHETSGTPASGFGLAMEWDLHDDANTSRMAAKLESVFTDPSTSAFDAYFTIYTAGAGAEADATGGSSTYMRLFGGNSALLQLGQVGGSVLVAVDNSGAFTTGSWEATDVAVAHGGTGASTAGDARTNLGLAIGSDVQAYNADLAAIAGLTSAADRGIYYTGAGTASLFTLTAAGRAILDDADASAQRTTLGLAIGSDVQAYSTDLATLAGLGSALQIPRTNAGGTAIEWVDPAAGSNEFADDVFRIQDDSDATKELAFQLSGLTTSTTRTLTVPDASGTIALTSDLSSYQPLDGDLTAISGLTSAADKGIYYTGAGTASLFDLSSFGRSLVDDADASAARTTLGVAIGSDVQAYDAELAALAGLTSAADKLPYFTGSGTASLTDLTSFARTLLDDADAAAARTTLGITSGDTVVPGTIHARLSLDSSAGISSGTSTDLYWVPYQGSQQALFDGSDWQWYDLSSSLSFDLTTDTDIDSASIATSAVYDVFCDYNGGSPQLALKKWTSTTSRATGLTTQDGVLVLTGATDHVYLGTIYVYDGGSGTQTTRDDSFLRYLWNYYRRVPYDDYDEETTNSWTSAGNNGTWAAVNSTTAAPWRHSFVIGIQDSPMSAQAHLFASAGSEGYTVAVSQDWTSGTPSRTSGSWGAILGVASVEARWTATPAVGLHYVQAAETDSSTGTSPTVIGDNNLGAGSGQVAIQSGMHVQGWH